MSGGLFRSSQQSPATPASAAASSPSKAAENDGLFRKPAITNKKITEPELYQAIDALPSLPLVVQMILSRVGLDSKADANDLEELGVARYGDRYATAEMVNSSFYALPNQVVDLGQAVAIVVSVH